MYNRLPTTRLLLTTTVLMLIVSQLAGCARLNQMLDTESPPPQPTATQRASDPGTPTAAPTEPAATPARDTTRLTLWTTEVLGPVGQTPGARRLSAQIAAFEAANPNVTVEIVLKKPYGNGGMLDFLSSTKAAVPESLPDVAILDIRELHMAAQRELIQPLDGRITPATAQDLVAAARRAGQVDSVWFGLPFEANLQHLIYNTELVATAPVTWTQVLRMSTQYLFPAGGQAAVAREGPLVNDAFITQYYGVGASLAGESGQPALDQEAAEAVLQFYADGIAAGVISKTAIQYTSVEDTWPIYLAEEVGIANASVHQFLENRASFQKSAFAPIPTRDGTVTSVFKGWAYVLVAEQSERQEIAWALIEWLTSPERLGEWALAANYLPARLSALPEDPEDEYLMFLAELLQNAQIRPTGAKHDEIGRALQRAVQAVFAGTATPAEAAGQAAASVP